MNRSLATTLVLGLAACGGGGHHGPDPSPHLEVTGCQLPSGSGVLNARLDSPLGAVPYCWVYPDGTVKVTLDATPGATLKVDGTARTVGADGRAEVTVALDGALLRAPIAAAVSGGASDAAPPPTRLRLEPEGAAPIEGELRVVLGRSATDRTRAMLAAVAAGTQLPRAALGTSPPPVVPGSAVLIPADTGHLVAVGRAASLGQLDLVAVAHDGAHHGAGTCGPYDHFGVLPHEDVDVTVTVYQASTATKVTERTFTDGFEDCSMFVSGRPGEKPTVLSRPEDKAIEAYLAELTSARAQAGG
jgi:hypothetical protein